MPAEWPEDQVKLNEHHHKRITEDAGCFEDILDRDTLRPRIHRGQMRQGEYYERSLVPLTKYRRKFRARKAKLEEGSLQGEKHPLATYHVDAELVVTITDPLEEIIITCYHKHFGGSHKTQTRPGEALLRYDRYLEDRKKDYTYTDFNLLTSRS